MNFGENAERAFKREIKEELGFKKVKLGKFVNIWSFTSLRNGINHHFIILDFEFFAGEDKIRLSKEHTEYRWIDIKEIGKIKMREGHKKSFKNYFKLSCKIP